MAADDFKCMKHLNGINVISILITSVRSDICVSFLGTWLLISQSTRLLNPSCHVNVVFNRAALSQYDLIYFLTFSKQETPACIRYLRSLKCVKLMHSLWLDFFLYIVYSLAMGTDMEHHTVSVLVSIHTAFTAVSLHGLDSLQACQYVMWCLTTV